jgi:predicted nucleotidyltransferase
MRNGFLNELLNWGENDELIDSIILVGSYARGTETMESDVDLVIMTLEKSELVTDPNFIHQFGNVQKFSVELWGACTSIRVFYEEMEVEFGIVDPSWMDVPLDAGTKRVLTDGYKVILDKKGYFDNMTERLM